jgi:NADH dehydrogenase FAD-containing subunit
MKPVLILGGGFGGIYAALEFEKRQDPDFEVTLNSQDNFFLFTPMLQLIERLEEADAECAASRWQLDLMRVSLCG